MSDFFKLNDILYIKCRHKNTIRKTLKIQPNVVQKGGGVLVKLTFLSKKKYL